MNFKNKSIFAVLCALAINVSVAQKKKKKLKFEPTVESLQQYECPEWFRDAKLGIYMHWGVYSVAEMGEWYARKLYDEKMPEYKYHVENYGHPSEFGYGDFIDMWKAEKFDPDALVGLFKEAGAKYFTPCAVHHDNFDLWDSKYQKYNAKNMGPKKDLIGMFREATLKHGLKFGVTTHLSRSYSWMNVANQADTTGDKAGVPYDGAQGKYKGLYPEKHDDVHPRAPLNAPKEWRDHWAKRIKDLIDKYNPDHLYFDCSVPFRGDDKGQTGLDVISYYYNHSIKKNKGNLEAVMCVKERPWQGLYAPGMTTLDYERGKASSILPDAWQTDDSMGPWGYNKRITDYMTADAVIDKLIDIVSKNGNMLLNVPIKADGTLDERATAILKDMGKWMKINGEGIYGTRPWYMFGEGHTNEIPHKVVESPYKSTDIRFTTKDGFVYAYILDKHVLKKPVKIQNITLTNTRLKPVKNVTMLGYDGELKWDQHPDGLMIDFPKDAKGMYAYGFKIEFEK